jgi:hypothetical protein
MHYEAWEFLKQFADDKKHHILDIGGRDINTSQQGYSLSNLWPNSRITVLDKEPGPNVDIVADACSFKSPMLFSLIICTEVFEHTYRWPLIIEMARRAILWEGRFLITCAGIGRAEHSGIIDGPLQEGEYYRNLSGIELKEHLTRSQFSSVVTYHAQHGQRDLQAIARPI